MVKDANNIFYLLQKHFNSHVLPAVRSSLTVFPQAVAFKNEVGSLLPCTKTCFSLLTQRRRRRPAHDTAGAQDRRGH